MAIAVERRHTDMNIDSTKDKMDIEEDISTFKSIIFDDTTQNTTVEVIKTKENAIQKLADIYVKKGDAQALRHFLTELRPLFNFFSKAKTAKVVRTIIDSIAKIPNSTDLQV